MGVRLLRQYTPSGRALTAALGRVGHRARRNSCLSAGRLGQAVVEVAVVAHLVPWLECPHFATAGSHDRDGASWRRRASWSEPCPGRHRIRADTDARRGRADPSLPAVATECHETPFGRRRGSATLRGASDRARPRRPGLTRAPDAATAQIAPSGCSRQQALTVRNAHAAAIEPALSDVRLRRNPRDYRTGLTGRSVRVSAALTRELALPAVQVEHRRLPVARSGCGLVSARC